MKKRKTLKRERVNRALMSIFEYPLTIVEAPMGYGKTTAVREFLAARDVRVCGPPFIQTAIRGKHFGTEWQLRLAALTK